MKNINSIFFKVLTVFLLLICHSSIAQENCSNGIDDDGDGLIDCLDPDCLTDPACPAFAVPGSCLPIGYYPDITGTAGGYKASPSTALVNIPIAANSNRVSLIIQGVFQNAPVDAGTGVNDLNHAQERVIWGRVEMDLDNSITSGWVEYMINNHESRRFSWVDQPMGPATTVTYTTVGHDMTELTDYEFSFDADPSNLMIGCTRAELDISYYAIFYGNFATQSMTRIEGQDPSQYPVYFDAGAAPVNLTSTIDLLPAPDQPDYIQLRAIGINQNRIGTAGVLVQDTREESLSIKYILIDLNTMTASGNMSINNGNIPDMCTAFSFEDYDVTSGLPIIANSTTMGDIVGNETPPNQIAVPDMTIEIVGDQLILTRSDVYGNDFNEIYYVEFLKYSDQPYSSSFFITENAYSGPLDIGYDLGGSFDGISVDGFVDFTIPEGAKRGYLEIRANGLWSPSSLPYYVGPAPSNTTSTNGNQMYAFTEVNFDLNETTGFFVTLTTSSQQQLYAWQAVPIDPLVDITTTGIYGQLPNSDERLNFEIIPPSTFRVHLENDKIAYERTLQMTFLGSKVNLVYSTFNQNSSIFTGCDSVYFDMEVCNSGGADLTQAVPVSFYNGNPTTDPAAIYLQTEIYNLNVDQGQCETFTFGIDIASLGGATSGDITIVLNDNGSFGGTPGNTILSTFTPLQLADQGNPVLECEYNQNIISAPWMLVPPPPPTITFNQNTFVICPNEDATIIGTPSGTTGEFTYDWSPAAGTTDQITVSPNVLTWYYLTVTDVCSSVTDSVKVEIGTVDINSIDVVDATNCPGVAGTPGEITINPSDPSWLYTITGGSTVIGPQSSNLFTGLDGGIWYFINVVDDNGCQIDTNIFVGLGANAVTADFITDSLSDVTCFNMFDGGAYVENIAGGITGPYDVIWTHTSGPYDSTTVGMGGVSDIDNLMGGNWTVTVTDQDGCAWSTLFTIFEPDELILDWLSNDPTCYLFEDGSVTMNTSGGNGNNTFTIEDDLGNLLNPGNTNTANQLGAGWYYGTIEDENGCTTIDSIFIDDPGQLTIDLNLIDPSCHGIPTGLAIVDTVYNYTGDYNQISYFWNPNLGQPIGIGADSLQNMPEGNYNLQINDANGCSESFDFSINYPDSIYFTQLGVDPAYCRLYSYQVGHGVVYASAAGGTGNLTYDWFDVDDEVSSNNTTWGGLDPGNYTITVYDDNGCVLFNSLYLDSLNPIADFEMTSPQFVTNYEGTSPVNVHFENLSMYFANPNNPNADTTFFWNFDHNNISWVISHDVNETFDSTYTGGNYEVCLVALNANGCSDTLCKDLVIFTGLEFTPVNIFTPNGDGINDVFTFKDKAVAVVEFNCVIVNRWGVVMYTMTSINDAWDGTDPNGDDCTDGVYFYTYEGKAENGEEFEGQGNIQLISSE